eukprot:TRINITY_DN47400_c0_g1_i1.p1 TRINITY_DN47400_c0_g1~~TRINITY_DN47400_c0_g1_i1.p1  ORF type:complete len:567 (-),score=122.09 TRINITY_DN47400_c0_g1_i1:81-1679(-)
MAEKPSSAGGALAPEPEASGSAVPPPGERAAAFLKTKLCKFYVLGACTRGKACQFAHDNSEMQPLPDLFRTKLCKTLMATGVCDDPDCRYAHHKEELRSAPPVLEQARQRSSFASREGPETLDVSQSQGRSGQQESAKEQQWQQRSKKQSLPQQARQQKSQYEQKQQRKQQQEFQKQQQLQQTMLMPQVSEPWPQQLLGQMATGFLVQAAAFEAEQAAQIHEVHAAMLRAEADRIQADYYAQDLQQFPLQAGSGCGSSLSPGFQGSPGEWDSSRHRLDLEEKIQDYMNGHHVVVKNTFLHFSESPPPASPGGLRPVMSASARLCTLGGSESDYGDGNSEVSSDIHHPVKINSETLRSSHGGLPSNLSSNSLCSMATLAEDELLMGGPMSCPSIQMQQPGFSGAAAAQVGFQSCGYPLPTVDSSAHWVVKNTFLDIDQGHVPSGRLRPIASAAGRLDALVEEKAMTGDAAAEAAPITSGDDEPVPASVSKKSHSGMLRQFTGASSGSVSSEVSTQAPAESSGGESERHAQVAC